MTSYKFQLILAPPSSRNIELYCNHLNTGQVWYSNGSFVSGCQMVLCLNGGLKIGLKKSLIKVKNVWYLNGLTGHVT